MAERVIVQILFSSHLSFPGSHQKATLLSRAPEMVAERGQFGEKEVQEFGVASRSKSPHLDQKGIRMCLKARRHDFCCLFPSLPVTLEG